MAGRVFMVLDVESIGLHGEAFAFAYVVVDESGTELRSGYAACSPDAAVGTDEDRAWVTANVPNLTVTCGSPREVRDRFWAAWEQEKARGVTLVAEYGWPVEARFLAACIDDDPTTRRVEGPFPLHEVATAVLASGTESLAESERKPRELPKHHPVADARKSARVFTASLRR